MSMIEPSFQMWVTFALVVVAMLLYALERMTLEVISIGLLGFMLIFFHLFPVIGPEGENVLDTDRLLAGFADPALIAILALLVIGQGIVQTGALEWPMQTLGRLGASRPLRIIAFALAGVLLVSAVMNNTPVVAIFIPLLSGFAERIGRRASSLMMPLSFTAILGGMTTLIGSSTNLLVAGSVASLGLGQIGFFDFTLPGFVLAGVGLLYVLFLMPRLLPERGSLAGALVGGEGKQFIAEIDVTPESRFAGATAVAGLFPQLKEVTVRLIQRGDEALLPPFDGVTLTPGDVVIVAATRKALTGILSASPELLENRGAPSPRGAMSRGEPVAVPTTSQADQILAEAVVAPASRMIGRNLIQIGFRHQTGCIVVGVQRRSRMIRTGMNDIRLEAGDVLLIVGPEDRVMDLRTNRDVLLLEWSASDMPALAHARRAMAILAGVVAVAAANLLPITVAALIGAALMISGGCLNIRQASRALDRRLIFIIATALALGTALHETGGAAFLAHSLVAVFSNNGTTLILSALFLLIALTTNVVSNNATAVLFTPIAVGIAQDVGGDPMIFVYTVIFAANCSFATPMGYQTNLLVMGPGHYRFVDFMRAGAPLILLLWAVFTVFVPWYYGL